MSLDLFYKHPQLTQVADISEPHRRTNSLGRHHPSHPRLRPQPSRAPLSAKLHPDPLLLPPLPRSSLIHPRHPQLLPSPLHRPPSLPSLLCAVLCAAEIASPALQGAFGAPGDRRRRRRVPSCRPVDREQVVRQGLRRAAGRCGVGLEGGEGVDGRHRVDYLVACLGLCESGAV